MKSLRPEFAPAYGRLLLWSLGVYIFFFEIRDLAQGGVHSWWTSWMDGESIALSLSAIFNFSLYSLGSYTVLLFFYRQSRVLSFLLLLLNALICMLLRHFVEESCYPALLGFDNYFDSMPLSAYLFDNLYYATIFTAVGLVFFFVQFSGEKERQSRHLQIAQQKSELQFLRSQVNPHFLFNTLNNIYSLVHSQSGQALPAMEKLTTMLRYALYEKADKVTFAKEWGYIEDFIALQKMRYDYPIAIQIEIAEGVPSLQVPPLSLIPFVENAFKHGHLKAAEGFIRIEALISEASFVFRVQNAKKTQQKDAVGGIGLENVQKRLDLIYRGQASLQIREDPRSFEVELRIPLVLCQLSRSKT